MLPVNVLLSKWNLARTWTFLLPPCNISFASWKASEAVSRIVDEVSPPTNSRIVLPPPRLAMRSCCSCLPALSWGCVGREGESKRKYTESYPCEWGKTCCMRGAIGWARMKIDGTDPIARKNGSRSTICFRATFEASLNPVYIEQQQ